MAITITTTEGVFVYQGLNPETGAPKWAFFAKRRDGTLRSRPTPRRFKKILKHTGRPV